MKNILIISLSGVFFGFFTGCAPVTCEELDRHAQIAGFYKDPTDNNKIKLYDDSKPKKADIYKTAGSKKIAKKTYTEQIEAYGALKKGAEAKLKCKFSGEKRVSTTSRDTEYVENDYEVELSEFKSEFESREKEAKEELKKLK